MTIKNISILELGGTICSIAAHPTSEFYKGATSSVAEFLDDFNLSDRINITLERYSKKISHEFSIDELIELSMKMQNTLNSPACDGIVISMGTNALEDIAYFVGLVVQTRKPIVFTGAHFPQNSLNFDGKKNLYNALLIASSESSRKMGVLVTFNDYIVTARDAIKITPGLNNNFSMEGIGVIGYVVGNEVYFKAKPLYKHTYLSDFSILKINKLPKTVIIYAHLGMEDLFIKSSIDAGIDGIISAGYGKGYQKKCVTQALYQAVKKDIAVVRCARSGYGYSNRDTSYDENNGFIVARELPPHKCSLLLSVALSMTKDKLSLQQIFKEY